MGIQSSTLLGLIQHLFDKYADYVESPPDEKKLILTLARPVLGLRLILVWHRDGHYELIMSRADLSLRLICAPNATLHVDRFARRPYGRSLPKCWQPSYSLWVDMLRGESLVVWLLRPAVYRHFTVPAEQLV